MAGTEIYQEIKDCVKKIDYKCNIFLDFHQNQQNLSFKTLLFSKLINENPNFLKCQLLVNATIFCLINRDVHVTFQYMYKDKTELETCFVYKYMAHAQI